MRCRPFPWARSKARTSNHTPPPPCSMNPRVDSLSQMVNAACFAVSRRLGLLLAHSALPTQYLAALMQTRAVRTALARPGGPRSSSYACWPLQDSMLGYWLLRLSSERNISIELVNSPFMIQHHPFPSVTHGAFSNASIMLHGLKRRWHAPYFGLAARRGSGAFVPFRRACGSCKALGWSHWPGSPVTEQWTCCGCNGCCSHRSK